MVKARKRGKEMAKRNTPAKAGGRCFNCRKDVREDDYCHGCSSYVCDGCDNRGANGAAGLHLPEDHLEPA